MRTLAFLFALSTATLGQPLSQRLLSLVAAERAFAAATAHLGVRDGFLTFFADDAVALDSTFGRYKTGMAQRPATAYPLKTVLLWAPAEGDVSAAGDLGYLTGPSKVLASDGKGPIIYAGWYFSIWKRQPVGIWKVYIDVGTETPGQTIGIDTVTFRPAPTHREQADSSQKGGIDALRKTDADFNGGILEGKILVSRMAATVRLHRNGGLPVVGRDSCVARFRAQRGFSAKTKDGGISSSGDLGFTYGSTRTGTSNDRYVRTWKWDANDGWILVADVSVPDRH